MAALGARWGLTAAEAGAALAICAGHTIAERAEPRGISVHTARNQLKAAMAKTEARRQSDLGRTHYADPSILR